MDWHDYDLLRASGAATVHGYYGGGTAGGYHDEVGLKHGPTACQSQISRISIQQLKFLTFLTQLKTKLSAVGRKT